MGKTRERPAGGGAVSKTKHPSKKKTRSKAAAPTAVPGGSNWQALSQVRRRTLHRPFTCLVESCNFRRSPAVRRPVPIDLAPDRAAPLLSPAVLIVPERRVLIVSLNRASLVRQKIGAGKNPTARRKRAEREAAAAAAAESAENDALRRSGAGKPHGLMKKPMPTGRNTALTDTIALDCEMVGVGEDGKRSILARVSVVNEDGNVVLDSFVAPTEAVTDYRTRVSGVRPQDLRGAPSFKEIQAKMAAILSGRTLVGHALKNDLKVLALAHPRKDTRDTALYRPLTRPLRANERAQDTGIARGRGSRSLKELCAQHLGLEIQGGEHSSVDDARAALLLYKKNQKQWEREVRVASGGGAGKVGGAGQKAGAGGSGVDSDDEEAVGNAKKRFKGGGKNKGKKQRGMKSSGSAKGDIFASGAERVNLFER